MNPVRVTFRRTLGQARGFYTTALASAGFLSAAAAMFAFNLDAAEGLRVRLAPLWTASLSPFLPVLAAILGMDVWSDERKTGRIDLLLASPVRERDFVLGKWLGVWTILAFNVAVSLAASWGFLLFFAPRLLEGRSFLSFLPGVAALLFQGALWCAVAVAASAFFRNAAAAATTTVVLLFALPRGIWQALKVWSPDGGMRFGEMPFDAHAYDLAAGFVSTGTVVSYAVLTVAALFAASKAIAALRCVGRGGRGLLASVWTTVGLAFACSALAVSLACRLDTTMDFPVGDAESRFTARTRSVLSESQGSVLVTAFMDVKDGRFRDVGHFLRALKAEADAQCGVQIEIRYVDPNLNADVATRLVRENVRPGSLVFERGGVVVGSLSLDEGWGERACASLIERAAHPFSKSCVYWTTGHGEASFGDHERDGMSDIARDLAQIGYGNRSIDLAGGGTIADDCALVVIAGARNEFSETELDRLRSYLAGGGRDEGGRLLVLLDSARPGGIPTLLSEWGIRPIETRKSEDRKTISGTDVMVSEFSGHVIVAPLAGQRVVLDAPVSFEPSAAVEGAAAGADRKSYSELLKSCGSCFAAVAESGGTGDDLAIRPTRLAAVGDLAFILNGPLKRSGHANRDFFLNIVKYLSGRDAITPSDVDADVLASDFDRASRGRFIVVSAVVFPLLYFLFLFPFVVRRRMR